MIVFGILGHAKAGKDTVVDYVLRKIDYKQLNGDFAGKAISECIQNKVAIADGIRAVARAIGFAEYQLTSQDLKEKIVPEFGMTPRQAMQGIGSAFRNTFGHEFWLKSFSNRIAAFRHEDFGTILYVTDIRLPYEVEYLKKNYNATIIKVERPSLDLTLPMYQHHTEKYVDLIPYDRLILNNGSLKDLYARLDKGINYIVDVCEERFRDRYKKNHPGGENGQ